MAVRFCERCKKPFQEGHVLYDNYVYCSEDCLRKDNVGNEDVDGKTMEEMYENDVQYYTDWRSILPLYDVIEVYVVFDTIFFERQNAEKVANEHLASGEKVKNKWLVIPQDELDALEGDEGLTGTQYILFDNLNHAAEYYNEIEESL